MDKPVEDVCGGKGVSSPSLRKLIELVERAEAKAKAEETQKEAAGWGNGNLE